MRGRKGHMKGGAANHGVSVSDAPAKKMGVRKDTMGAAHSKADPGMVEGLKTPINGGRKPRKNGGRVGCDASPLSSAKTGSPAPGRKFD